jgi:hypothetical protein
MISAGADPISEVREVIIGRNSQVWNVVRNNPQIASRFSVEISHADVVGFRFTARDRVWVFAYSRIEAENSRLLGALQTAQVSQVVYVSTATANVTALTRCYEYPRVKKQAEEEARRRVNARILTLGLVVHDVRHLPPGLNAVTFYDRIESFLLLPQWPEKDSTQTRLFEMVTVPFDSYWELQAYSAYNWVQWALRRWPCVLRPVDFLLRLFGVRWYGYINLSNRLWATTTL